jgi:hypothetical protein
MRNTVNANPVDRRLVHPVSATEYLIILVFFGGFTVFGAAVVGNAVAGGIDLGSRCVAGTADTCRATTPEYEEFKPYFVPVVDETLAAR